MASTSPHTNRRSELWKNILLSFASVGGTLLLLEIGLRLFAPVPLVASDLFLVTERVPEVQARTARRALKPNVQCRHTSGEYDVAVRINNKGLRDSERPYQKPPNTTRILFLGDSFTFGYGVEESERFTNLVQAQFSKESPGNGHRYEIINAGVPSWGTTDGLLWLREEGLKYHPDLVVLCFYENDVRDDKDRDLFTLRGGKLVPKGHMQQPGKTGQKLTPGYVTNDPFNDLVLNVTPNKAASLREPQVSFLVAHSHLARLTRQVWLTKKSSNSQHQPEEFTETLASAQELTARLMEEVQLVSQKAGADFKLILIPRKQDVQRGDATLKKYPVLHKWAKAQAPGLILDLVSGLHTTPESQSLYFLKDKHFTPRGHAVAAKLIVSFLKPNLKSR